MLIVAPASETKSAPPERGEPVDLGRLSFPSLAAVRARVLDALVRTSTRSDALARLLVGPSFASEIARNEQLATMPTRPAIEVYCGALHDALDWATLSPDAKDRAASWLVIVSPLWGALRPADRIPAYRLNVCADLVGLRALEPVWRTVLPAALAEAAGPHGIIVDLRSSSYLAMGRPAGLGDRTVEVRVVRGDGTGRSAGGHDAKQARGDLARYLLEAGQDTATPEALVEALAERWYVVLRPPARRGGPRIMDVVVHS